MEKKVKTPKKPKVKLIGKDGNAYFIMGAVSQALRKAGFDKLYVDEYMKESMSGDYDNLLRTAMKYADVY